MQWRCPLLSVCVCATGECDTIYDYRTGGHVNMWPRSHNLFVDHVPHTGNQHTNTLKTHTHTLTGDRVSQHRGKYIVFQPELKIIYITFYHRIIWTAIVSARMYKKRSKILYQFLRNMCKLNIDHYFTTLIRPGYDSVSVSLWRPRLPSKPCTQATLKPPCALLTQVRTIFAIEPHARRVLTAPQHNGES